MKFEYSDDKVEKILTDDKTLQKKVGLEIAKSVRKRMKQLEATDNFNQYLTKVALGKPHPLKGDFDNCYGISITPNYRIIVEPVGTKLDIDSLKECKILNVKGVLDYHGDKNEWLIP